MAETCPECGNTGGIAGPEELMTGEEAAFNYEGGDYECNECGEKFSTE